MSDLTEDIVEDLVDLVSDIFYDNNKGPNLLGPFLLICLAVLILYLVLH